MEEELAVHRLGEMGAGSQKVIKKSRHLEQQCETFKRRARKEISNGGCYVISRTYRSSNKKFKLTTRFFL